MLDAECAHTGLLWIFYVTELYRQKAKHYALFFSSEIKMVFFFMSQTKPWHFKPVFNSPGQDRYCPKGLIANKMSVFINLLKCGYIEE